ncbi:hypothetical protein [Actinomadura hibisca]|uniref:hypothetical protein n=1 Tax=Actinomadura hibisca TaxID=68565 RepID=UPI000832AB43|nr:hypothetical protein [Actinomadura hibisca]
MSRPDDHLDAVQAATAMIVLARTLNDLDGCVAVVDTRTEVPTVLAGNRDAWGTATVRVWVSGRAFIWQHGVCPCLALDEFVSLIHRVGPHEGF